MRAQEIVVDPPVTDVELRRNGHRPARSPARFVVYAMGLLIALFAADAAFVVWSLRDALTDTRAHMQEGADALERGDAPAARSEFSRALNDTGRAAGLTRHPSYAVFSNVPVLGRDAQTLDAVVAAAELAARAGMTAAAGAGELGIAPDDAAEAIYRDGRVRFDTIARAHTIAVTVADLLDEAAGVLEGAPSPTLGAVAAARRIAQDEVAAAVDSVRRGEVLLDALPSLLAQGSQRRYFLAFQTPSEARGTGGLIGLYGVLDVRDGRIRLKHLAGIKELVFAPLGKLRAPAWFERRYGDLFALRQWQQVNQSPHFPVVARVIVEMYESATGERLDGVIAMDPVALGYLTRATGPLRSEELDVAVGPNNVARVVLHDSYKKLEGRKAQTRYLKGLIRGFWAKIRTGDVVATALGKGLAEAVATQHLKLYTRADKEALRLLGADGNITAHGPNLQLIFHNNVAANKIDYFLERSIRTEMRLTDAGEARVTTTVVLDNRAPPGTPSYMLGPGVRGDPPGLNRMYLNFVLPQGAEVEDFDVPGRPAPPFRAREAGYPVVWDIVEIKAGQSTRVQVTYRVPGAADVTEDGGSFTLTLVPQPAVIPARLELEISPPYGFAFAAPDVGTITAAGQLRLSGILDRTVVVEMTLVRD